MKDPSETTPELTPTPARESTPRSALAPGIERLIDRGTLTSVQAAEVTAFDAAARELIAAGEMTPAQAEAMGRMLGLRYSAERSERSGRRSLQ